MTLGKPDGVGAGLVWSRGTPGRLLGFFPARIEELVRYGEGEPGAVGTVKHATLRIGDRLVRCIDSVPVHEFGFTPAVSLAARMQTAEAVDRVCARLAQEGTVLMPAGRYPFSERFGWVTDRFGVSE